MTVANSNVVIGQPKSGTQYIHPEITFKGRGGWELAIKIEVVESIDEDGDIYYSEEKYSVYTTNTKIIDSLNSAKDDDDIDSIYSIYKDIVELILTENNIEFKNITVDKGRVYMIDVIF